MSYFTLFLISYLPIALFLFIFLQLPRFSEEDFRWSYATTQTKHSVLGDLLFALFWLPISLLSPFRQLYAHLKRRNHV